MYITQSIKNQTIHSFNSLLVILNPKKHSIYKVLLKFKTVKGTSTLDFICCHLNLMDNVPLALCSNFKPITFLLFLFQVSLNWLTWHKFQPSLHRRIYVENRMVPLSIQPSQRSQHIPNKFDLGISSLIWSPIKLVVLSPPSKSWSKHINIVLCAIIAQWVEGTRWISSLSLLCVMNLSTTVISLINPTNRCEPKVSYSLLCLR